MWESGSPMCRAPREIGAGFSKLLSAYKEEKYKTKQRLISRAVDGLAASPANPSS